MRYIMRRKRRVKGKKIIIFIIILLFIGIGVYVGYNKLLTREVINDDKVIENKDKEK